MKDPRLELALFRLLAELRARLHGLREPEKALRIAVRLASDFFVADGACIALLPPGRSEPAPIYALPKGAPWEPGLFADFMHVRRPEVPHNVLLAPVLRRGRNWAVLGLRRNDRDFGRSAVPALARFASTISDHVQQIDQMRIAEVRSRIDRKMMEKMRTKDLLYEILHGLRSLTRYDHSAAVLIHEEAPGSLELVAEQIAWHKSKSRSIGRILHLDAEVRSLLEAGEVHGFDRVDGVWREWNGLDAAALAEVLDYNEPEDTREMSMLCAPLPTRDGFLGVLKIAACHTESLGSFEANLVRRFLPQAAVAIQNLQRTETLQRGILEAEKKHAVANLARGVSHDINNALGSVLPLVQQLIAEAREGQVDESVLLSDLEQIESSLQTCRRIFGGMLSFARGAAFNQGEADVSRAIDSTMAILAESLQRHAIAVEVDVAEGLPPIGVGQGDLEQLILNLAANARDAMTSGGTLRVAARPGPRGVEITVEDTGVGIPPQDLARVEEPFFTTKRHGTGLGLSICRSIAWAVKGRLAIRSQPGRGTRVRVRLPVETRS